MVPASLQYSHHPQSRAMPPPHSGTPQMPPASVSNMMYHNDSRDILRMRRQQQHSVQMEKHAQAQVSQPHVVRDSLHGRPVVWRWVPFTAEGAAGYIPPATSSMNPRVIYATAKKIEGGNNSEELPALLTGGELQQAREVLIQNKVDSLVSAVTTTPSTTPAALRIPQVTVPPSMIPRHDELAGQKPLLHKANHMPPPPSSQASNHGKDEASNSEPGGDLEVANLLLNMGGSAKSKDSVKKKNETSNSDNKLSPMKKLLPPKPNKAPIPPQKPPAFEDIYLENWVGGSVSLHTPEDDDVLSPLHCFMRRYCVEAFSATAEDVATPRYGKSHGFKVEIGQVGIRCLHCKGSPAGKRAERAVCYPSSLRNIYHSIETWQRRHSLVCKEITPWVRKSILELMESSKTRAGGRRQYWEDSARRLGMVDTSRGVRFARKPGDHGPLPSPGSGQEGDLTLPPHKPVPVVKVEDKDLVTDYLFLLMEQMQTCRFTEEDRTGGRSKIKDNKVGFPGMECRHCQGRAGFGRYFPSSVAALSLANSDRNVYNHLQKCRRCPESVKTELVRLQKNQSHSKNRRGLRKLFFNRIWNRMHGEDDKQDEENKKEESRQASPSNPTVPATQPKPSPDFVPYTGMPRGLPQLPPPPMMAHPAHPTHPYHRGIHPQVTVNNFRGY